MKTTHRPSITAWPSRDQKARFAALAASRGLSESKLLGLLIDSVLERNPVEPSVARHRRNSEAADRITIRLRPGDSEWLRLRAVGRGMHPSTYAAAVVRAHVRADPPMPQNELALLERSLGEVRKSGSALRAIALAIEAGQGADGPLNAKLATLLQALEGLRQELREVVRVNRISWEAADVETAC
jgi:hypothetical protein